MNVLTINGRLTKEVLIKKTETGKTYCKFSVAVNRSKDGVDYIPCLAWGKRAEFLAEHFQKGDGINLIGKLQSGQYDNKEGEKVFTLEVLVNQVSFPVGVKRTEIV